MANTFLSRTMGTPTDATKQTLSVWVKLASSGNYQGLVSSQYNSTTGGAGHFLGNSESIYSQWTYNGSQNAETRTTALARDFSGWYHIVSTQDASQSGTDKSKIWINGVLQTDFVNDNRSNFSTHASWFANGKTLYIGRKFDNTFYFNGTMSHLHLCDGYAYQASDFGSFDSTTGEWKINTAPSVNYGNQGFFILKDGNSVTDQSGNSNNFSVGGGTLTKTEDCPSNVFATLNPLSSGSSMTFTNGNTGFLTSGTWESAPTTLAMSSGKYYCEFKPTSVLGSGNSFMMFGVEAPKNVSAWINNYPGYTSTGYAYGWDGDKRNNAGTSSYGNSFSQNDIIGIALDMDNKKLYFHKNGTYQNSGVPTSGSTGTGALPLTEDEYYFVVSGYNNGANATCKSNFGNGYFGTAAVSSAGTNASNIGIFEYDVPTGYTALSTKGLNL